MTYRRAGTLGFSVLIMIFLEGFRARYEMMAHGSPRQGTGWPLCIIQEHFSALTQNEVEVHSVSPT